MSDIEFEYEGTKYGFDLEDITFGQAMTIQKEVDLTIGELYDQMNGTSARPGDPRAIVAMLWLGKQVAGEACRIGDLAEMNPFKVLVRRQTSAKPSSSKPESAKKSADPTSSGGRTRKARTTAT